MYLAHLLYKYGNDFILTDEEKEELDFIDEDLPPLNRYFPGWKIKEMNSIKSGLILNYKSYETAEYLGYFKGEQREGLGVFIKENGLLLVC